MDAITWLKPVIATAVPLVRHLFAQAGEIGFLANGENGLRDAVEIALAAMTQARYEAQIAARRRLRDSRRPEALAPTYRALVENGFAGLLD